MRKTSSQKQQTPQASAQQAAAAVDTRRQGGQNKPSRQDVVLVVEDVHSLRRFLERYLKRSGCEVLLAENGEQAVEVFKANAARIDCVFMDVEMPGMNGNQAASAIRQFEKGLKGHVKVPILRLSSDQSEASILLSQKHGMTKTSQLLSKQPYDFDQLKVVLQHYSLRSTKEMRLNLAWITKVAEMAKEANSLRRSHSCDDLLNSRKLMGQSSLRGPCSPLSASSAFDH